MHLHHLMDGINEDKISKGDNWFTKPVRGFINRYKDWTTQFEYKSFLFKIYHNHSHGEDHVDERWKERIETGDGEFNNPITHRWETIKDIPGWVSHNINELNGIMKNAIKEIDDNFGLEDDDLNAYIVISRKLKVAVYFIIMGVEGYYGSDDWRSQRQILIQTIEHPNMIHSHERFYDMKTDNDFVDFKRIMVEGVEQKYLILYV